MLSTTISTRPTRARAKVIATSAPDAFALTSVFLKSSRVGSWATAVTMKKNKKFRDSTEEVRLSTRPTRNSLSVKRVVRDASVML
jgi:hypothetical protein